MGTSKFLIPYSLFLIPYSLFLIRRVSFPDKTKPTANPYLRAMPSYNIDKNKNEDAMKLLVS